MAEKQESDYSLTGQSIVLESPEKMQPKELKAKQYIRKRIQDPSLRDMVLDALNLNQPQEG